jgi:uncharacterized protein
MFNEQVTVNSLKYDRKIRRSWKCDLVKQDGMLLEFVGVFDIEVVHSHLGVIRPGTISYEYYWLDRWYNVFRFHEPDGQLRNYYCNVNVPPTFTDGVLEYVDLDIDIIVWKNWSREVLDLDEFEENADKFGYPESIRTQVDKTLSELNAIIAARRFPFDYDPDKNLGTNSG